MLSHCYIIKANCCISHCYITKANCCFTVKLQRQTVVSLLLTNAFKQTILSPPKQTVVSNLILPQQTVWSLIYHVFLKQTAVSLLHCQSKPLHVPLLYCQSKLLCHYFIVEANCCVCYHCIV